MSTPHCCDDDCNNEPTCGDNNDDPQCDDNKDDDEEDSSDNSDSEDDCTGPQGPTGLKGAQGDIGPQGFQGNEGAHGSQGFTGHKGSQGFQGVSDAGPQGFQGFDNTPGPQGFQGTAAGGSFTPAFARFFGRTAGTGQDPTTTDYAATVGAGAQMPFPRTDFMTGGIVPVPLSTTAFTLPTAGLYKVMWAVQTTTPGQLQLVLDGTILSQTTFGDDSTAGDAGHLLLGNAYVQTVASAQIWVQNPPGNSTALIIRPTDSASTHAFAQCITIERLM